MRLTNKDQRIQALQQVPILSGLSRTALGKLARSVHEVEVPEGGYLTRQGNTGDEMYIVLDGHFAVRRHTRTVAMCTKGDFYGEMSLIDGMPRDANVVAETDAQVLVIHRSDFDTLLESPRVGKSVMRTLAGRLREADDKVLG